MANGDLNKNPSVQRSFYTLNNKNNQVDNNLPRYRGNHQYHEGGVGRSEMFRNPSWQPSWRLPMQRFLPSFPEDEQLHPDFKSSDIAGIFNATVTPNGTICLKLREDVRVDMTVDGAIRMFNTKYDMIVALSKTGTASALIHPVGRVYHFGPRVEIQANRQRGQNQYAKMWYKGISFTAEQSAAVFLVDAAGTRTTTDVFLDMSQDFSLNIFYHESRHGESCIDEAVSLLQRGQYWNSDDGTDNWIINNVKISQAADGLVRIHRNNNKYKIRSSPSFGSTCITSPFLHCTASPRHLFVRRGERRLHFDGSTFTVRNAGHSAGFDHKNQLKVY